MEQDNVFIEELISYEETIKKFISLHERNQGPKLFIQDLGTGKDNGKGFVQKIREYEHRNSKSLCPILMVIQDLGQIDITVKANGYLKRPLNNLEDIRTKIAKCL